jgi:hypothetical protein
LAQNSRCGAVALECFRVLGREVGRAGVELITIREVNHVIVVRGFGRLGLEVELVVMEVDEPVALVDLVHLDQELGRGDLRAVLGQVVTQDASRREKGLGLELVGDAPALACGLPPEDQVGAAEAERSPP